jgi:hypothetical protein
MSQTEKAALYKELKDAGVQFSKHYREYSTDELQEAVTTLRSQQPAAAEPEPQFDPAATAAAFAALSEPVESAPPPAPEIPRPAPEVQASRGPQSPRPPVAPRNPNEMAGQRLNTKDELTPLRTDPETGYVWYQEEVLKPGYPKPRARRVLKYLDSGTKTETVQDGKYVETFEVAGEGQARPSEAKITLPSYQVGIYKDPRLPFKVHVYNNNRGFDLFEVQKYYGGPEMVPAEIKRIYVENVLCFDIRTTVQSIQREYRQLQLARKV